MTIFAFVNLVDVPREAGMFAEGPPDWWHLIAGITGFSAMGLAPWFPLTATGIGLVPLIIAILINRGTGVEPFVLASCLIIVAIKLRRRYLWILCGIYSAWAFTMTLKVKNEFFGWTYAVIIFAAALLGLLARHFVADRIADRRRLAELQAENERIRSEEREVLARELHDVVAHELSIIALQITAYGDSDDPVKLRTALSKIDRASRSALMELRALVGVLRDPSSANAPIDPASMLEQANVAYTAESIAATLTSEGFHPQMNLGILPDQLDLSLHTTISRILTETSTNIMRYAPPGTDCTFTVVTYPDRIQVQVISPLSDIQPASWQSNGWGLRGIRERVDLTGGSLEAGPVDGQWIVTASLRRYS